MNIEEHFDGGHGSAADRTKKPVQPQWLNRFIRREEMKITINKADIMPNYKNKQQAINHVLF